VEKCFPCVSLRADAEGQHLMGHDMAGRWKAEVAFDCDAIFRGATGRYRHGMDLFGSGCGCVVLACLGQLERTPRRGQSKQECLRRFRMQ